jgi:arylsulfatase A-like enzyme
VVEEIDWSVGRIVETLRQLGLEDSTLVIFTSDNGPWLAQAEDGGSALPLRGGKATTFEGGMRVPGVMSWPGTIPAGAVCKEMVTTMDLLPTLARLAGTSAATDRIIDGRDIWPILSGQPNARSPHEELFYYYKNELRAVRSGRWKLITAHEYVTWPLPDKHRVPLSLYDLETDIGETVNVAEEHPDVVKRLEALLESARDDLGDSLTTRQGRNVRPPGRVPEPH